MLKPVIVDSSKLDLSGLSSRRALEIGHKSKVDSVLSTKESSVPSLPSPASSTVSSPSGEGSGAKPLTALEQLKEKVIDQTHVCMQSDRVDHPECIDLPFLQCL